MVEGADYMVTLTLRATVAVTFAPIERERPISNADAIDNAIGSIPESVFEALAGEGIDLAYPIDGTAELLNRFTN